VRPTLFLAIALSGCASEMVSVDVTGDGGNAYAAWEDAQGRRLEAFDWGAGARNQVVDYVFVVDNSVSMRSVIGKVRKGFESLDTDAFPPETRIAVLSTLPADPDDLSRLHNAVPPKVLRHDAGFGHFVSAKTIRRAKRVKRLASSYPMEGCGDDGWFRPGETNAAGESCLVAHTQSTLMVAETEAGLTAFKQLLQRNEGQLTFRPGAAVNVVFVSDTHDPGVGARVAGDLLTDRPTAEELIELVDRDNVISSLRFHAIAPEVECVERWFHLGASYFDVADATGGATIDMCTAEDYRPILDQLFDDGARPIKPVFALGSKAQSVESVTVDGIDTPFTVHPSGRVVQVDLPDAPASAVGSTEPAQTVEVHYQRTAKIQRLPGPQRAMQR